VSNDDGLPSEVGNCEMCLLHVLAISEYCLHFFSDGSIFIWGTIDVVDQNWVQQRVGFQFVSLNKGTIDEHACCTIVKQRRGGDRV